ncbi:hypothetical protein [Paramagnetospirillum magneticum]|uniref:hypothetical protein n=1 Tax=Paramagnetospirillum magneticum TaxID=84159 RepID=UPI0002EF1051|nr:hypothetical protein [Paramagnetospirillum magneticum]
MLGWLSRLVLDKRAREALKRPAPKAAARPNPGAPRARERDPATALAEAEERMKRLPPEKAQLIRSAMLVHRARQSVLAELSDEERDKLEQVARKALLGGGS